MAVIVYLDSQDFINFSRRPMAKEHEEVFEKLLEYKKSGVAKFGVSLFHIVEVLNPDSEGFESCQRENGETIYALCEGNAFPFLYEVVGGKAEFPNNGMWIPDIGVTGLAEFFDQKYIKKQIAEHLRGKLGVTRNDRRRVANPKFLASYILTADYDIPEIFEMIGLNRHDLAALFRFPAAKRKELRERLFSWLADPRYYCDALAKAHPNENPLRKLLDDQFEDARKNLEELFNSLKKQKEAMANFEESVRALEELAINNQYEEIHRLKDLRKQLKQLRREQRGFFQKLEIPSDEERFSFLRSYAEGLFRADGKPKPSELTDLLHLSYHAEVDLIRVDRRLGELLKNDVSLREKLVPRLVQLPSKIEEAAASKAETATD